MSEHEPMDQTTLNIMEVYRRQVTDLETCLYNERQDSELLRDDVRHKDSLVETLERNSRQHESSIQNLKGTIEARDAKITKLEGVIESLKIELQEERAAHTKTKEGSE